MKHWAAIGFLAASAAVWAAPACQVVEGERIRATDLAAASPNFMALPAGTDLGPAPSVGARRTFQPEELIRLANLYGVTVAGSPAGLCFERASQTLTREKLLPLLKQTLARDGVGIEVADFSRSPLPLGELEFRLEGLTPAGLWRGRVNYGQARSTPIWAKVRLIDESRIRLNYDAGRPSPPVLNRKDVERGDPVRVEAGSGTVRLAFEARAESAGRTGDMILLKNPLNGQRFQARVEGKGKVSVKK